MSLEGFVSSFLGAAAAGAITTYLTHLFSERRARNERRIAKLEQTLAEMRTGLDTWDHYAGEAGFYADQREQLEAMGEALKVFGSNFTQEVLRLWFNEKEDYTGPPLREQMMAAIRQVERELGHPDPVELLPKKE
jgi:hypothetical protein